MNLKETARNVPALKVRREVVPEHRRKAQTNGTVLGIVSAAIGLGLIIFVPHVHVAIGCTLLGFAGFVASKDQVLSFAKAVPQIIAAVVGALGGRKPDAD